MSDHGRKAHLTIVEGGRDAGPELVGAAECCEILGVRSSNLRKVAGLPDPVQVVKASPLWLKSEIDALAALRRGAR